MRSPKHHGLMSRRRGSILAALRRPYASWIGLLALLIQLTVVAALPAQTQTPREQAASALSAAIGAPVALCDQADADRSGKSHHSSCCDDCPLCRLSHHAAAILPEWIAQAIAATSPQSDDFGAIGSDQPAPQIFFDNARARAPPALA
jgi:Protein of unknown function (DUF2946)